MQTMMAAATPAMAADRDSRLRALAVGLWAAYYTRCYLHDEIVCSGYGADGPAPYGRDEEKAVRDNAERVLAETKAERLRLGISDAMWASAMAEAQALDRDEGHRLGVRTWTAVIASR